MKQIEGAPTFNSKDPQTWAGKEVAVKLKYVNPDDRWVDIIFVTSIFGNQAVGEKRMYFAGRVVQAWPTYFDTTAIEEITEFEQKVPK